MALAYSNIIVQLREISLTNRPQELYDVSPKGTVPVLCLNDSTIIDESLDIMKWSVNQDDTNYWFNYKMKMQNKMIAEYDNKFKHWLDRYKYSDRYPEHNENYYKYKCDEYLSKLNILLEHNFYVLSDDILLVDVAIFPFIRQFANVNMDWFENSYVNISRWLNNLIESDLFLSVMDKYPNYKDDPAPLIINFNK